MGTRLQRQDNTLIWVLVGGGIALVAILLALIIGGVALFFVLRSPTLRPSGSPPTASTKPASGRDRLVGVWLADMINGKGSSVMDLRSNGTMIMTISHKNGLQTTIQGSWEVALESGNRMSLRRTSPQADGTIEIQFTDANTFIVLGQGGGMFYRRR